MSLIKCEDCGKEISDKAESCPNCGCPVELKNEKIICEDCGKEIDVKCKSCPNCGCPIEANNSYYVCEKCGTIVDKDALSCPNCNEYFEIKYSKNKRFWESLDYDQQKRLTKEFYHRKDVIPMSTRVGLTIYYILAALCLCGALVNDYGLWWLVWLILFVGLFVLIYNVIKGVSDEEKFKDWLRNKYNIYK